MRSILHLAPEQTLVETFVVERRASSLYVELRGEGSVIIGQRELPDEGSCDELAQAAAVVLGAWLTDVHPDFAGALPEPAAPPPPPPPPPPPEEPAPASEPAAEPPPSVPPAPIRREAEVPRPRAPGRPRALQLGAAAALDFTANELAPGAGLNLDYGFSERGFGLAAFGIVTKKRTESLGPGVVSWRRWPVGAGPRYRIRAAYLQLDISAGPVAGWLYLEGKGFDDNAQDAGLSWGGFGSVRLAFPKDLSPVLTLNAQIYPGKSTAYVTGVSPEQEWPLPTLSLSLLAGIHWSL